MSEKFNEATRVQMPAMVHLTRLGYKYFGKINEEMSGSVYDPDTNILIDVFVNQFKKLNPTREGEALQTLKQIRQELDNDDLGRSFYNRLKMVSPVRLIDFDEPKNNVFHFTAEFTCRRDTEEFRPDITLFVNGLPLVFIEVKKPNNHGGMVAESERMIKQRFPNKKFRRFINITQLMIFSNNREYDTMGGIVPIQGAFYCTGARGAVPFNCFREENIANQEIAPFIKNFAYAAVDTDAEKKILSDFNCQIIRHTPEYQTNMNVNTPTNRIITSMCSPKRLLFLLKYGIAYKRSEREVNGKIETTDEKHIMRYQQMFAALAVREKLEKGKTSGVIWHTQGSGKTALSYYLSYVLSDFYAERSKVAKFYFIVDRLDLLEQAKDEFEARGLEVKTANTREELMQQFRTQQAQEGYTGRSEITVVNIQRFAEDKEKVDLPSYATNLQRVFIIDEAHRGYNPKGCFLANLFEADKNSIKIALTGTPLLKEERASWQVFGEYLHTYYYDKSIQDGYTLKIIREEMETTYREKLSQIYEHLETLVKKKDVPKQDIIEHETYVKALLAYIINDLKRFRKIQGDPTLGAMIVCETSNQARKMYELFNDVQDEQNQTAELKSHYVAKLILHDVDDKIIRKDNAQEQFKKNMTVDILIVYNMLLTGFDAPRLKRLYLGRKLKDHNLLQAITRVNRPYKQMRYGFVVDFADIKANFQQTNEAYIKELNRFNDQDETGLVLNNTFAQVIEDKDALIAQMQEVRQALFEYTTDNVEEFSSEISTIEDKTELLKLKKVLTSARDCCNIVRTFGDDELKAAFARLEIEKLPAMIAEVQRQIDSINQKEAFAVDETIKRTINEAMLDITFNFRKIGEEELKIVSGNPQEEFESKWRKVIEAFMENIDQDDPEYVTLREAFMQRFKEHGFVLDSVEEFNAHSRALDDILKKLAELQKRNSVLLRKYNGDAKFARVHKRIQEENNRRKAKQQKPIVSAYDELIIDVLMGIKAQVDQKVYDRNDILRKDAYFESTVMTEITNGMNKMNLVSEREDRLFIQSRLASQYLMQYHETYPAA